MDPLAPLPSVPTPATAQTAVTKLAARDPKLAQVAKQFEAIFLQELFKGLEKPEGEEDLFGDSQASRTFDQMHHQALSEQAAGGLGIADLLYRDLIAKSAAKQLPTTPAAPAP